jgi:hypothetical protein
MPQITGPTLELTLKATMKLQQIINRFHYVGQSAGTPDLPTFAANWITGVLTHVADITHVDVNYLEIDIQHLTPGGAFLIDPVSFFGNVTSGDSLPPFVAFDFTLLRHGLGERNGYKRFAGVGEVSQNGGVITSGALSLANTLATAMHGLISDGVIDFEPAVQRKQINHVAQVPPKYFSISSVIYARIGSQNTRKIGRGA